MHDSPAGKSYADGRGGEIRLPLGDLSFADEVVSFRKGDPFAAVEPTALAISKDGKTWVDVGVIAGGVASIDIKGAANPFDTYSFLKLTDNRAACFGEWPGADIDAIAAIGAGRRVTLDASLLFDVDKSVLKPIAENALRELATEINATPNARVVLEGHTDSDGPDAHNQKLSEQGQEPTRRGSDHRGAVTARGATLCRR